MLWTALVCGLGGSLGACVVLVLALVVWSMVRPKQLSERDNILIEEQARAIDLLEERNNIGRAQLVFLERIAMAISDTATKDASAGLEGGADVCTR